VLADRRGELLELRLLEPLARLVRVPLDRLHGQPEETIERNPNQARRHVGAAVDKRLSDRDARIVAARPNAAIDQGRLATLRAEAAAIRARAVDEGQPFVNETRNTFERIIADIETELDRK
jgi:hypothetical protein